MFMHACLQLALGSQMCVFIFICACDCEYKKQQQREGGGCRASSVENVGAERAGFNCGALALGWSRVEAKEKRGKNKGRKGLVSLIAWMNDSFLPLAFCSFILTPHGPIHWLALVRWRRHIHLRLLLEDCD